MRALPRQIVIRAVGPLAVIAILSACVTASGQSPSATAPQAPPPTVAATQEPRGSLATPPAPSTAPGPPGQARSGASNPAAQVYQRNGASVVNITSVALVRTAQGLAEQPQGVGSGFILDGDGRIVTNNHVVQDADELTVTFQDGATVPARLLGRDPDNDLAVIQVDPNGADDEGRSVRSRLKPATLGDSDRIVIGEDAIAIGSPLGLRQTVTAGIVSALRTPGEETARGQLDLLGGAVQTDAAVNPGNSGGPLFNAAGEVIGVNSSILSETGSNIGIGFAIPVNVVKRVVPDLIRTGRYRHPLIGISSIPLTQIGQAAKRALGLPPNQKGLLVQEASAGARQAGIRSGTRSVNLGGVTVNVGGDIVVAIDGRPMTTGGDLRGYIENNKRPGDKVTLTVVRGGQRLDVEVTLSERPAA